MSVPASAAPDPLRAALRAHFGYDAFRPGQEAVLRSVLSGRPTIAILPTGGGKSLCYQLPAMLLDGVTVVVSPLVALMKDQVDALRARGVAATFINSSLSEAERAERQAGLARGTWKLVYVAPERFKSPSFWNAMKGVRVSLLAVDEAHCISAWGHDFRPEYQRLAQAQGQLRAERVLALTATATPEVRQDIASALELKDPKVFVAGFDRPNLFIEVAQVSGDQDKMGRVLALARQGGPGLVYAATRKNVEKVVGMLRASGIGALGYHAGMDDGARTTAQDDFVGGKVPVVVATNAFGMGVDKADIRFVVHYDVPRSVEGYYQEIGRAGRDGAPSLALLLFSFADVMLQKRIIEGGRPSQAVVCAVWEAALRLEQGAIDRLADAAKVHPAEAQSAVRLLESAGHLERGRGRSSEFSVATPEAKAKSLRIDFELLAQRSMRERQMLDRLVRFADVPSCRRRNLLSYFGDPEAPRTCPSCDRCAGGRAPAPVAVPKAARGASRGEAGSRRTGSSGSAARSAPSSGPAAALPAGPVDEQVLAALRELRTTLAREAKVPPYVVFHDATLRELAAALPRDEASFLAVKGAGPGRWERYGEQVLAITKKGVRPAAQIQAPLTPSAPRPGTRVREASARYPAPAEGQQRGREPPPWLDQPPARQGSSAVQQPGVDRRQDRLWTLYAEGASIVRMAAELGLVPAEIASRLAEERDPATPLAVARLLGEDRLAAIQAASAGEDDLVAIRRRLAFPVALAEIRLALMR